MPDDESQALQTIQGVYRQAAQLGQIAPYAQQYMQYAPQFQEWLKSQQKPVEQPKAWYSDFWSPPEYNPTWEAMLQQDEHGNIVAKPGMPMDIAPKYIQYQQWRREQAAKFMSNPHEFMAPTIKKLAAEIAQEQVQKHFETYQATQSSQQFVSENSPWLYEMDPQGNPKMEAVFDPHTGQYRNQRKLSQFGQSFSQHVAMEAKRQQARGYQDVEEQKRLAYNAVMLEDAMSQLKAMQAQLAAFQSGQTPAAPQQTALQNANAAALAQHGQKLPAKNGNTTPAPEQVTRDNLHRVMASRMTAAGINGIK